MFFFQHVEYIRPFLSGLQMFLLMNLITVFRGGGRFPLYVTCCFSFTALKILSLSLKFLIIMYLGVGLWVHLNLNSLGFQDLGICFLLRLGRFSAIISSNKKFVPFSLSFSVTLIMVNVSLLILPSKSLKVSLSHSFLHLLLWLVKFYCFILKLTDFFFCFI